MNTKQMTTAEQLIDRWVKQKFRAGKTEEDLNETVFIYGDQLLHLATDEWGSMNVESKGVNDVVIFRLPEEPTVENICRACGMEYDDEKAAMECCAYLE
ncbi:hypothetical protein [Evansella halocellulosilytica]|uniref:hypothetical protein n=1 Tax=Evansella halocellulosilytica TaxID=2011013 RepID=UPI0011553B12|nr:hypothetical protein [Evansella halocellulosilytica]